MTTIFFFIIILNVLLIIYDSLYNLHFKKNDAQLRSQYYLSHKNCFSLIMSKLYLYTVWPL
jgi:hypothetical protein